MDYIDESAVKPINAFRTGSSFQRSGSLAVIVSGLLSVLTAYCLIPVAQAAPVGGNIVGGSGSINTNGLTTTIHQNTQSQIINWNSYNVKANETVNYLQPNASAISLNRILSNNATQIFGQINANGQVVLVNPNGIFFGNTASVNVGGLIASGLDISPSDFMNGDYFFNEVIGSDGSIINSGLINASLGGSVALIGKQVSNEGVISAQLGSISLAAGKAAVLTFDQQGLLGVQVTEAILQDEIGVDPAVINSGDITAQGGRVLLTGSASQDVFSQAVNSGDIEQATSVVVNDDGTFTLGSGANVVNSGSIDVSSIEDNGAGDVVILGQNVEHSGAIAADSAIGSAGMVELQAVDTTELKGQATISAKAGNIGTGGQIKILGEKVGLLDNSEVNVSGANGGGELLIGGDREGLNKAIKNAEFVYLGSGSNAFADALFTGDGGKIITYANDTARVYGGLFARGGSLDGNGGFIETSGKMGFEIGVAPDISATSGAGGLWLIDPYDITIDDSDSNYDVPTVNEPAYVSSGDSAHISVSTIQSGLDTGSVEIKTVDGDGGLQNGKITLDAHLDYNGIGAGKSLTLNAFGDIEIIGGRRIYDSVTLGDSINVNLYANGSVIIGNGSYIDLRGGDFTVGGVGGNTPASYTNYGTIDTSSDNGGGDITITTTTGDVRLGGLWVNDDDSWFEFSDTTQIDPGGDITVNAGNDIYFDQGYNYNSTMGGLNNSGGYSSPTVPSITLNAKNSIYINAGISDTIGTYWDTQNIILKADSEGNGVGDITINADIYTGGGNFTASGVKFSSAGHIINTDYNRSGVDSTTSTGGDVSLTMTGTAVLGDIITEKLSTLTDIPNNIYAFCGTGVNDACGSLTVIAGGTIANNANNTLSIHDFSTFTSNTSSNITLDQDNDFVGQVNVTNAQDLTLKDSSSLTLGNIDIAGALSVTATGGGITQAPGTRVAVDSTSSFITSNSNSDIKLNSASNDFLGVVSFSNNGQHSADITFNNSSATTQLGATTVHGNLTVNAQGNLTLSSGTTISGYSDGSGENPTYLNFNFGLNDSNSTFQLSSGAKISSTTGQGDTVAVNINGGTNNTDGTGDNTFKFISTSSILVNNTLTINGNSGSDTFEIGINLSGAVNGAAGDDTFSVSSNSINVSNINGGADSDTLFGSDNTNTWNITGSNSGNLNSNNVSDFQQIENLTGGTAADTFNISDAGQVSGLIDGDTNGSDNTVNDSLNLTAKAVAVTVSLDAGFDSTGSNDFAISNIETLTGNGSYSNSLEGTNNATTWRISGSDIGAVSESASYDLATNSIPGSSQEGVTRYSNFANLNGGTAADVYTIESVGDVSGLIDGGTDGTNTAINDVIDLTAKTTVPVTVYLGASTNSTTGNVFAINNIETLTADGTNTNTLVSSDIATTWRLDGSDSGAVSSTIDLSISIPAGDREGVTKFTHFANLTGGTAADTFIVDNNGTTTTGNLSGQINGGASLDVGQYDQLVGPNLNTTWALTNNNEGTLTDTATSGVNLSIDFIGIEKLQAGGGDDTFNFGTFDVSGSVDAGGNTVVGDEIDLSGQQTVIFDISDLTTGRTGFESVKGNWNGSTGNSTITGPNSKNNWQITGENSGEIVGVIAFTNFNYVTGGTNIDDFTITDAGYITGLINGGSDGDAATTNDTVDITGKAEAVSVYLGTPSSTASQYSFAVSNIETLSANGAYANTLIGTDNATTWRISGSNIGAVSSAYDLSSNSIPAGNQEGVTKFTNFANLTGGTAADTFIIEDTGQVSGLIEGRNDGTDTTINDILNLTAKTAAINVYLDATSNSISANVFAVSNIETLSSNGSNANTLVGSDVATTWRLDSSDSGAVSNTYDLSSNSIPAGNQEGVTKFTNFANLTGGTETDTYIVENTGDITGLIDGGSDGVAVTTNDSLDLTAKTTAITVQLGSSLSTLMADVYDIVNIETLSGNSGNANTLLGTDNATTWRLDSSDGGAVSSTEDLSSLIPTGSTEGITKFTNFANLTGGTEADTYIVENTGDITGLIDGGSDGVTVTTNDSLDLTAKTTAVSVQLDSSLSTLTDAIDIANIETVNGNSGNSNTVNGANSETTWLIDTGNSGAIGNAAPLASGIPLGTIEGVIKYSGFDTFNGGTAADTYKIISVSVQATVDGDLAANSANYDKLIGPDINTKWTIDRNNGGSLVDKSTSGTDLNITFDDIENLQSGSGDDSFAFLNGFNVVGSVEAGSQTTSGFDEVDYSSQTTVEFNMADGLDSSRTGFEAVKGNGSDSTIKGANASNKWVIDGINSGYLQGGLAFTGFNNITGGSIDDTFTFESGGELTGVIDGNDNTTGKDMIDLTSKIAKVLVQVSSTPNLNSNGILEFTNIEQIDANTDAALVNQIIANNQATNNWLIDGSNSGLLNTNLRFNGFSVLTGADNVNDNFTVADGGSIRNTVTGGAGTGTDQVINMRTASTGWAITAANAVTVSNTNFTGIENLLGSDSQVDTFNLQAVNAGLDIDGGSNTTDAIVNQLTGTVAWIIDGTNSGSVSGNTFSDIETLTGADNVNDNFTVENGGSIRNTVTGGAGTGTDQVINMRTTNTDWSITNTNAITVSNTDFTGIENLYGSDDSDDTFYLGANGGLTGRVEGGASVNDEIVSQRTAPTTWNINSIDAGNVTGIAQFSDIENLTGNNQNDTFNYTMNTSSISGMVDGGTLLSSESDSDFVDMSSMSNSLSVDMENDFSNIERFKANGNAELIGRDTENFWRIFNLSDPNIDTPTVIVKNQGTVTDSDDLVTTFEDFNNVTGGILADTFQIEANGGIEGTIDGGSHPLDQPDNPFAADYLDQSNLAVVDISVDTALSGYSNIKNLEGIRGNGTASILRASDSGSIWTLDGHNSGNVISGGNSTSFTDFNILQGGTGDDEFIFLAGSSLGAQSGIDLVSRINGAAGDDTVTVNLDGDNAIIALFSGNGEVSVTGTQLSFSDITSTDSDTLHIIGATTGFDSASYLADFNNDIAVHSYTKTSASILASVSYSGVETITDFVQADVLEVSGQGDNNTVTLTSSGVGAGTFVVENIANSFPLVSYQNKSSLSVQNLGNSGLIVISSDLNLDSNTGYFNFSADEIDNSGSYTLTAHTLILDSINIDVATPIYTDIDQLQITASTADIRVENSRASGINLLQVDTTGLLALISAGGIGDNDTQGLTSTGDLDLQANGLIQLDNPDNALEGVVSFDTNNLGSVVLNNSGSATKTELGVIDAGGNDLSVTSLNALITSTDTLIANQGQFDAGSFAISLQNSDNNLNTLVVDSAESVSITDIDGIKLGNITMGTAAGTGSFVLNSVGVTQQSGTTFFQQSNAGVAGTVTFNSGNGIIELNQDNQFVGTVSLNNSGNQNVSISDIDEIVLAASSLGSGEFTVTAGDGVRQTGAVVQQSGAGAVSIEVGNGEIDLSNIDNVFTGSIYMLNTGAGDISLTNDYDIQVVGITGGGKLELSTIGAYDITQTGAISVLGSTVLSVDDGQSILLPLVDVEGNPVNHFEQSVTLKTNNSGSLQDVKISNNTALDLALSDISGDLNIDTLGAVTGLGAWSVEGDTVVDSHGTDVTLTDNLNDFKQIAFVDANDVSLTDKNGVILGTDTKSNDINGNLSVTTLSEGIAQNSNSSIRVDHITTLNAASGADNIDLGFANNNFNIVSITSAQNVTLVDTNDITVNSTSINGYLDVTADGSIGDGDIGLSVTGLTSFTTGTGDDITLDSTDNELSGPITLSTSLPGALGNVVVTNNLDTALGAVEANNLNVYSAGNITQQGGFVVNNDTHLSANSTDFGPQNIVLNGSGSNSLNQLWVENAHDVIIDNSGFDLTINQMNASGLIDITSRDLTSNSAISANGINVDASGSAIFNDNVDSSAGIEIVAGELQLNSPVVAVNDLLLTTSSSNIEQNGNLSSSAGNIILDSAGNITMGGSTSTTTSNGSVFYTAENNIGLGLISAQNNDISLNSINGSIGDLNDGATNLRANSLTINSLTGIATELNKLDTQVAVMNIDNTGDGSIYIDQIGNVEIVKLQSTASGKEIFFETNADVIVDKGSVAVNRNNGDLRMNSLYGSFYGETTIDYSQPNITANTATFFVVNGTFGSTSRPIVFDVPKTGTIFIDAKTNSLLFYPEKPDDLTTTGLDISSLGVIQAISGEQLVEIESLGEIDPAIFTELRNYSSVDISIRMPRDQLYEDELEEEDKKDAEQVSLAF